ncbi:MAG: oxygen-dependent coproporphyrinogen oxidase [Bacteroidetes bacterium]|nr:MAG: oxygen-dependent coproporphyrinogen oxidase [Bacteroidota bacterium]
MQIKEHFRSHLLSLQNTICTALEQCDGKAKFKEDIWERPGGGGGKTRVMANGNVFEKAGVNFSQVDGVVTPAMKTQLQLSGHYFYATGVSLVLHPSNPFVPTVHANYRYFELYNQHHQVVDAWFGGGSDLTPYYLWEEDARHFHGVLKNTCDEFDSSFYPLFKKECDRYFVNKHRNNECRGIGGIFFDHLRGDEIRSIDFYRLFTQTVAEAFLPAYLPIVHKRQLLSFTKDNKYWQEIRRGRYTEFNLVHDRGTLFGLKTNGRTESILMSLPPTVRFDYAYEPAAGSPEYELQKICEMPRDWV